MATKFFIFGSINGQLEEAFGKLAKLHAKNSFNLAIVTGNLFAENQDEELLTKLLKGQIEIVCPTYFTVGTWALPARVIEKIEKGEEIAPNLFYLGKRTITKTSEGVRIVALGGLLDPSKTGLSLDEHLPFHTLDDAKALRGANSADVLLTTVWPKGVWKNSQKVLPMSTLDIPATDTVAELCEALKPRYHYTMSPQDFCFEREPFYPAEPSQDKSIPITRFISLAPWANAAKAKSMYAFTLSTEAIVNIPAGGTLSPFFQRKRAAEDSSLGYSRFAQDNDSYRPHKHRRRDRSPPPGPDQCYFCMKNETFTAHQVCSIGDNSYLETARGPLSDSTTFQEHGLPCPCNMIIAPFPHIPKLSKEYITDEFDEESLNATFAEMTRYRDALQSMVSTVSKNKLGAVTWEINRSRNIHVLWQFMPVPMDLILKTAGGKSLVEVGFQVLAEDMKLGKFVEKDFGLADEMEGDYLRVWIWGEEDNDQDGGRIISKSLVMPFDESIRFDLQFPRKVMAKLLSLEDRAIWQNVTQSEDEETAEATAFNKVFQPWNFAV